MTINDVKTLFWLIVVVTVGIAFMASWEVIRVVITVSLWTILAVVLLLVVVATPQALKLVYVYLKNWVDYFQHRIHTRHEELLQAQEKTLQYQLENEGRTAMLLESRSARPTYLRKWAGNETAQLKGPEQNLIGPPADLDKGLPKKVLFEDHVTFGEADFKNMFLGLTYDDTPVYVDFRKLIHTIIAGTTGSGKTVFLRTILTQLLLSSPRINLDLIDLGSQTFTFFDLPYAREIDEAEDIFNSWNIEFQRRRQLLEITRTPDGYPVEDLSEYNKYAETPLPYSVMLVEEGADLLRQSDLITNSVANLVEKARKFGLALIFVSQSVKANKMDTGIRGLFNTRFQFYVEEKPLSKVLIPHVDNRLIDSEGRAYMYAGRQYNYIIQTPWLEKKTMQDAGRQWAAALSVPSQDTTIIDLSGYDPEPQWEIVGGLPMIPKKHGTVKERLRAFFKACQELDIDLIRLTKKDVLQHLNITIGGANYAIYDEMFTEFKH